MESKAAIRATYREKRKQLSPEEREKKSILVTKQVLAYLEDRSDLVHFHIFLPIPRLLEVNTFPLVQALLEHQKALYTSVTDFEDGIMHTVKIDKTTRFEAAERGMLKPVPEEEVSPYHIQAIFIPLLAYDLFGNRLGYGKGYYDQFLGSFSGEILKIGLSFFPPMERIDTEDHDIPLDICVSPERICYF